jgi:hypothetical protein
MFLYIVFFLFYFIVFAFTHMCIHCLGHLPPTPCFLPFCIYFFLFNFLYVPYHIYQNLQNNVEYMWQEQTSYSTFRGKHLVFTITWLKEWDFHRNLEFKDINVWSEFVKNVRMDFGYDLMLLLHLLRWNFDFNFVAG